jgi:ubiquinone/menaquinone biosynthesis C-methylase UbiE
MMKSKPSQFDQEKIRRRYDSMARSYDATGQLVTAHRHDAMQALDVQPGECILDLACGPAVNFKSILEHLGANGLLVGLDYSSGMLKRAHQRVKRNQWSNVAPLLGDAARLPYADCVFDRVICTYSLNVIPLYQQALDEVSRVLKPGGTLVVLDGKLSNGPTRFLNPLMKLMARGPLTDITRPLRDEIARRFQNVRTTEYDFGYAFLAVAQRVGIGERSKP